MHVSVTFIDNEVMQTIFKLRMVILKITEVMLCLSSRTCHRQTERCTYILCKKWLKGFSRKSEQMEFAYIGEFSLLNKKQNSNEGVHQATNSYAFHQLESYAFIYLKVRIFFLKLCRSKDFCLLYLHSYSLVVYFYINHGSQSFGATDSGRVNIRV